MHLEVQDKREQLIRIMTENLAALRACLHLNQKQFAENIGVCRQTLIALEKNQNKMTWTMFLALVFMFELNEKTNRFLSFLEINPDDIRDMIKRGIQAG